MIGASWGTNVPCENCGAELNAAYAGEPPTHFYRCSRCSSRGLWRHLGERLHPARRDRERRDAKKSTTSIERPTRRL